MARQALQQEGLGVLGEGEIDVIRSHSTSGRLSFIFPDPLSSPPPCLDHIAFLFSLKTKMKTTLI